MKILKVLCCFLTCTLFALITLYITVSTVSAKDTVGDNKQNILCETQEVLHENASQNAVSDLVATDEQPTHPSLKVQEKEDNNNTGEDDISTTPPETPAMGNPVCFPIVDYTQNEKTTYTILQIKNSDMPYLLYVPSTANQYDSLPLVVWLHGSGERGTSTSYYQKVSLPKVISEWNLKNPDAYIVCPILKSGGDWMDRRSVNQVSSIIDSVCSEYNINVERISLTGASLGGIGSLYIGGELNDRLYRIATFSGYACGNCIKKITVPIVGFVGHPSYGEDPRSYEYMTKTFYREFGNISTKVMNSSHGGLPKDVFTIDENYDGYSDVFMWLIGE